MDAVRQGKLLWGSLLRRTERRMEGVAGEMVPCVGKALGLALFVGM